MNERSYVVPGWMAIAAAVLIPPTLVVGIILEIMMRRDPPVALMLLWPYVVVSGAQAFLAVVSFGRFKTLLNERHRFHEVDGLIVAVIVGTCLAVLLSLGARAATVLFGLGPEYAPILVAAFVVVTLPLSVLTIVFAVRLLHLESDLGGLLKPYAYATLAAAACFATFILAPLGLLINAVVMVMLGMIFLRKPTEEVPEFV